ncbi:MAG: Uma2 family endonuclease [Gemmataceae bacterium]|nr:Uma2 family endonuclease [Gemmataceae bacterium]
MTAAASSWPLADREPYRMSAETFRRMVEEGVFGFDSAGLIDGVVMAGGEPYRFDTDQYHRIAERGILGPKDRVVLLEGLLVQKMPIYPPHAWAVTGCARLLTFLLFPAWTVRSQQPITLSASEPEPDDWVARGPERTYAGRHPTASEVVLVVEVADSSLRTDRVDSARIYGDAGIPVYWIINLIDRQVEVMTQPTATGYAQRMDCLLGEAVPVILDGAHVGDLLVDDLLP